MMIPRLALSVRQPWAHALAMGWKPVENRRWRKPNPGLRFRGPVALHASKGMTRDEFESARDFIEDQGFTVPPPAEILRGGIVGVAVITDMVRDHPSPFFFGPVGIVMADARPVDFVPAGGALGFFEWKPMDVSLVPPPAKWMLPTPREEFLAEQLGEQGLLF